MEYVEIALIVAIVLLLVVFIIHQVVIFTRIVRQNRTLIESADHRLDKANEMVLTLAHSADSLAASIQHLKDMMVHLEEVYTTRNNSLTKNRDEIMTAYTKLLRRYEELQDKHDLLNQEMFGTLQELARRPTMNTTNNNGAND